MKFGVLYTIEWDKNEEDECPWLHGEHRGIPKWFDRAELLPKGSGIIDNPGIMRFVSKRLLTRKQFDRFVDYTQLVPTMEDTSGTILRGMWGFEFWAPAINFDGHHRDYIEHAYVTPVPDTEPRDLFGSFEEQDRYMWRAWERIKKAVVRTYGGTV